MLGALGLVLSSFIRQLENFAGVMNFVIFPLFFTSSALYPLWRVQQASPVIYWLSQINPFTHAVELIRFALYDEFNGVSALIVTSYLALFMIAAVIGYDPGRGLIARRGGGE
jgi:ABC-2 type transport system permease protein